MAKVLTGTKKTVSKASPKKAAPVKKYKIGAVKPAPKYKVEPELIVINGTAQPTLKKLVPAVKVRVSRGKSYDMSKKITGPTDAARYFRQYFTKYQVEGQEQFAIMYLNRSNTVLGIYMHSKGTMTSTSVDTKLILASGMQLAAEAMITCHNHPSGNLTPSDADKRMASALSKAAEAVDISLLDNLIITKDGINSY